MSNISNNRTDDLSDLVSQLLQAHQQRHSEAVEQIAYDLFYTMDQFNEEEIRFVMGQVLEIILENNWRNRNGNLSPCSSCILERCEGK